MVSQMRKTENDQSIAKAAENSTNETLTDQNCVENPHCPVTENNNVESPKCPVYENASLDSAVCPMTGKTSSESRKRAATDLTNCEGSQCPMSPTPENTPAESTECPKALEKETNTSNEASSDGSPAAKKPRLLGQFSTAKIETVNENLKEQSLTIQQITDYCKPLFVFKKIRVMRFT